MVNWKRFGKKYNKQFSRFEKKLPNVKGQPTKHLSSALIRSFGYGTSQQQSGVKRPVGRPPGIVKYHSPITGKPIRAVQYYSEMRYVRRRQAQMAQQRQLQMQQQYAKQGVPPQQIPQVMQQQRLQRFQAQTATPSSQLPNNAMPPQRPLWNRHGFVSQDVDALGNKRVVVRGLPESFWL